MNQTNQNQPFAVASLVFGFISITLGCCGFSLFSGAFGIFFAIMSFRKGRPMDSQSRLGLILSLIGIVIGVLSLLLSITSLIQNPAYMQQFNDTFRQIYGVDFQDLLRETYGIQTL